MNTDELTRRLQALPPPMSPPPDRFHAVEQRVRRRTRFVTGAIAGTAAAAAAVATTAVLLTGASPMRSDSHTVATEPPTPTRDATPTQDEPLPGSTTTIDLSDPVEVTATGTSTINLGARPDSATAVEISVVCLTAGRIVYPDGASMECERPAPDWQIADPRGSGQALIRLRPAQTTLTLTADDAAEWKAVAVYVRTETSDWAVNAKGETYGVQRHGKTPDLLAVITTDGQQGYAYAEELDGPQPTSPADALTQQEAQGATERSVPVYESDGETLLGEFVTR
jgi:hypothetical protein